MKVYTHPNCDSRLTLKKINRNVGTFNMIDKPKGRNIKGEEVYPVVILNIDGLNEVNTMIWQHKLPS